MNNYNPPKPVQKQQDSPIADLSYRNYNGELKTRGLRWWVISWTMMKLLKKNVGFWITSALVFLIYFLNGVQLYFTSNMPAGMNPFGGDEKTKYTLTFFQVNSGTNLLLFIIALTVGSGAISADNKANALLVYLSKPLTKADYLLGKWMVIFFTLFLETFVPSLVLYLYCLTSYLDKGFLKNDPMLFFKMIAAACVPAVMHASLLVGASAWSKAPRIASVFYASLYFGSLVVTGMVFGIVYRGDLERGQEVLKLSLSGMMDGIQQIIYHVTIKNPMATLAIPSPSLIVPLAIGLCVAGIAAARAKINAVEVVKG
ncbi:MAG: hypothetical protein NT023_19570 [Armatimonadetes bacterium]|nr:hypothetical protein [Armatimonadota bacterium]